MYISLNMFHQLKLKKKKKPKVAIVMNFNISDTRICHFLMPGVLHKDNFLICNVILWLISIYEKKNMAHFIACSNIERIAAILIK